MAKKSKESARTSWKKSRKGLKTSRPVVPSVEVKLERPWVDPDDAPPWTQEQLEAADLYRGNKLVRRGRPPSNNPKQALKLRLDADVVEHFRATGPGWQTRMNDALRRAVKLGSVS